MIRGKKNFINPPRLEMGCTLLYKLDDQFVEKHSQDRRRKDKDDQSTHVTQIDNANDFDDMAVLQSSNAQKEQQQEVLAYDENSLAQSESTPGMNLLLTK